MQMLMALLCQNNKLLQEKAVFYLHDAVTVTSAHLDLDDAAQHLHAHGVGLYLTNRAEHFASSIEALHGHTVLAYWDFLHIHWYVHLLD